MLLRPSHSRVAGQYAHQGEAMIRFAPSEGSPVRFVVARLAAGGARCVHLGIVLALVLTVAVGWLASPSFAVAQTTTPPAQTWTVQVGGDEPPTATPTYEPMAFFADPLI